jgi:hypothetical protein
MTEQDLSRKAVHKPFSTVVRPAKGSGVMNLFGGIVGLLKRLVPGMKLSMAIIVILQLVILYFFINPINLYNNYVNVQIVNEVAKLVSVDPNTFPVIALVSDADKLRGANAIQAQVYKDAVNGDYVIGYSSTIVIYRRSENKIIYNGDAPATILTKTQQTITTNIIARAKASGIITSDSTEQPVIQGVVDSTNITQLKALDARFYADVTAGDIIADFASNSTRIIYRPSTDTVVNKGVTKTTITTK